MNLDEAIRITDPATCREALYKYDPEERAVVENEARHMVTKQLRNAVMELCKLAFDQYLQKKGLEPLPAEGRRINMNRVTYWNDEYGCWSYHCSSGDAAKLLAAYEDTGLEPEEVLTAKENAEVACALNLLKEYQSVGSVEHFRELSQAERDGRLVVHGRWVKVPVPLRKGKYAPECSHCKQRLKPLNGELIYCPVCGAKMDLENETEEK